MSSTARTTWGDDVPPTDKAAPSTLLAGRYRIGALLGSGGSGQVHRAVDRLTGQDVAVKLVRLRFDRGWNRLRREIAALRHARLPGIVRLRDDGPTDDGWYLAMDLAAGAAFPGRAGPMPWTELRPLVLRLLEILLPMHCAGLVHRDIKPANVLVDPATGAITVVDLGLARGTALRAGPAESYFEGTPAYAPPEQVIGAEVDARGDLYAVGIMAWEALLGWRPRQTDTAGVEVPTAPASLDLPPAVVQTLTALLAPAPADRPRSAVEVIAALGGSPPSPLAGGSVLAEPAARWTVDELLPAFAPASRFLHLAEDGARLLYERTGGWPKLVDREVGAWLRNGLCHWDQGRVAVDRSRLDRLAALGGPLAPAGGPDPLLAPFETTVLAAARIAGPGATPAVLAEMCQCNPPPLQAALGALERKGVVWWLDGGGVGAAPGAPLDPALLDRLARRLPSGHPGRVQAALLQGSPGAALDEIEAALATTDDLSRRGGLLRLGLDLAREREDAAAIERWLADLAAQCITVRTGEAIEDALWEVGRTRLRNAEIDRIEGLLRAVHGQLAGCIPATDVADVPAFQHEALERVRRGEVVRVARRRGVEAMANQVESMADWASSGSADRLGQWLGWLGLARYRQCRSVEAAELHLRGWELRVTPRGRLAALVNAAAARLEAGEFEAAGQLAAEGLPMAIAQRDLICEVDLNWVGRAAAYRRGVPAQADVDLVEDARAAGAAAGPLALTEAAIAWRQGDIQTAADLVAIAVELTCAQRFDTWVLASAFQVALVPTSTLPSGLVAAARGIVIAPLRAQAIALLGVATGSAQLQAEARATALQTGSPPERRLDLLSMREAGASLELRDLFPSSRPRHHLESP